MTTGERLAAIKPYIMGGIIGAIVITIVGFSADWVVTSGTLVSKVEAARVNAFAEVCANQSVSSWTSDGKELAALEGWSNREQREALATQFLPAVDGLQALKDDILDVCEEQIEQAA